jgi:hypothetical protein
MANNKVKVDVIVDDKGSLQQVGKKAKTAADGLDKVAKGAGTADRNMKGAAQASANGTKNFSKMAQGMGGLVGVYATIAANVFALSAAFNFLKTGADLKVLEQGQLSYAAKTGIAMKSLSKDIVEATGSQITFQDAAQSAAIGLAAGLTQDQLKQIGSAAKDVSGILGRDVTDSFNRLVRGITKAEPELLDELGIVLRLETATKNYANALGKNVKELTAFERSQAVTVDTLGQVEEKFSSMLTEGQKLENEIAKLGIAFSENFIKPLQQGIVENLIPIVNFLSKNLLGLAGVLTLLAVPVTRALIPSMQGWAESSRKAADTARNSYAAVKKEIKELEIAQQRIKQSADPGAAAQQALQGIKTKGTGITKIQTGNFGALKPREISSLLAAAEAGKGAVTKMSKDMQVQYVAALRAMKAQSETTAGAIERRFKLMGQSLKIQFKGIQATWAATMAFLQTAATKAAKGIDLAFKAMGWLGFILLGIDLAKAAFAKFLDFISSEAEKAARDAKKAEKEAAEARESRYKGINDELERMIFSARELEGLEQTAALGNFVGNLDLLELSASIKSGSDQALRSIEVLKKGIIAYGGEVADLPEIVKTESRIETKMVGRSGRSAGREVEVVTEVRTVDEDALTTILQYISSLQEAGAAASELKQSFKDIENAQISLVASKKQQTEYDTLIDKISMNQILAAREGVSLTDKESQELARQGGLLKVLETARRKSLGISAQLETKEISLVQALRGASQEEEKILQSKYEEEKIASKISEHQDHTAFLRKLEIPELTEITQKRARELELLQEQLETQKLKTLLADIESKSAAANEQIEIQRAKTQLSSLKISRGATNGQKDRLKIEQDINNNTLDQKVLMEDIATQRQKALADGQGISAEEQRSIDLNKLKLQYLQEQNIELQRQQDLAVELEDTIKNSFESGFESGLADIIKGKETSLRDAVAALATGILESVADVIASKITDSVVDILFPTEDPAQKMKQAFISGGDYAAQQIKAAMSCEGTGVAGLEYITTTAERKEMPTKKKGIFDRLFGSSEEVTRDDTGAIEKVGIKKSVGSVDNFLGSLSDIFNKNAEGGLVEKLGTVFQAGGNIFSDLFAGFGNIFSNLLGGLGGGAGGGMGGILAQLVTSFFAKGGYAPGGFRAFASGGMVNKPTLGLVGEGKYNEAIVPLPNGRAIPVDMKGAGQQNNVTVNVTMNSEGGTTANDTQGMDGNKLGAAIARAVQQELQNQKRSGGILSPYGAS